MSNIVIARLINGITLNPLEFLLEDHPSKEYKEFESKEAACDFLREHVHVFPDTTNEQLEEIFQFMTVEEALAYEKNVLGHS